MGKCVSKWTQAEHQNRHEAAAACKAEQADANFAAAHGGKTFAQFYGTGKNRANAMNKCISSKRAAESAEDKQAVVNAARSCKAERKAMGTSAFAAKYGSNADKSNAFGRCVSKLVGQELGTTGRGRGAAALRPRGDRGSASPARGRGGAGRAAPRLLLDTPTRLQAALRIRAPRPASSRRVRQRR